MNLLDLHSQRAYPNLHSKIDGFLNICCTFKTFRRIHVVVSGNALKELCKLHLLYISNISCIKRWMYTRLLRNAFVWKFTEKNMRNSYILYMYCNGFSEAYRYFFLENSKSMTSEHQIQKQIEIYINSNRMNYTYVKPDESTKAIYKFGMYCFYLGQRTAMDYAYAIFMNPSQCVNGHYSLREYLKCNENSKLTSQNLSDIVVNGLKYINSNNKYIAKRVATFVQYIIKNEDILYTDVFDYKKEIKRLRKTLIKFIVPLIDQPIGKTTPFVKHVCKYFNPYEDKRKICKQDEKELEKYLRDTNVK